MCFRAYVHCHCVLGLTSTAIGSSLDKAKMFREHGLVSEAKKELIEVIFSKQNAKDRAEAYYVLGTMAFEQNDIAVALKTWSQLVADLPESDQAKLVKDKIKQLSEVVGEKSRAVVENAVAQSYLRHADFWSEEERDRKFIIDSSYISNVDVAVSWYDKVIQEFPKTEASRLAYEEKMLTLTGKIRTAINDIVDTIRAYGRKKAQQKFRESFDAYMPQLLSTFSAFEKDHPKAAPLQAFRYQIAQIYWLVEGNSTLTQKWLNLIIEQAGENDTFYRDLAERRLQSQGASISICFE